MFLTPFSFIVFGIIHYLVKQSRRTINSWSNQIVEFDRIIHPNDIHYGSGFLDSFCIEIAPEDRMKVLRNARVRDKIREYKQVRRIRRYAFLVTIALAAFYVYSLTLAYS